MWMGNEPRHYRAVTGVRQGFRVRTREPTGATKLYDRRQDEISLDEVEKIAI